LVWIWEKRLVYGAFIFYGIMSQFVIPRNHWSEIYPFFHWSLFSELQSEFQIVRLKILTTNEQNHEVSCFLEDCDFVSASFKNKRLYFLLQDLGQQADDLPAKQRQLEAVLNAAIPGKKFGYQVYRARVDLRAGGPKKSIKNNFLLFESGTK
jgi:hypothetical protein